MSPKIKTLLERGFSTIVLLSLLGGTVAWNEPIGYAGLICVLCNLTSWEWFNMLKGTNANRVLSLVCGLIYPWLLAAICLMPVYGTGAETMVELLDGGISVALGFLVLYTLLAFCGQLFRMDYRGKTGAEVLDGMGMTLLSFVYPVWMFSFALLCVDVEATIWTMLWIVLFTKMSDIWAYVSGILLGGKFITRKFSPSVSPKKTWEGIIGSIIITLTVGAILLPALGLMTWEANIEVTSATFNVVCDHETTKVVGAKAATATEEGYTGDTVCADCGKVLEAGTTIPKLEPVPTGDVIAIASVVALMSLAGILFATKKRQSV